MAAWYPQGLQTTLRQKNEVISLPCTPSGDPAYAFSGKKPDSAFLYSFQRGQQCTSVVSDYLKNRHMCVPPGVIDHRGVLTTWGCCGHCTMFYDPVRILHWSTAPEPSCSDIASSPIITSAAQRRDNLATSLKSGDIAVHDNHTL